MTDSANRTWAGLAGVPARLALMSPALARAPGREIYLAAQATSLFASVHEPFDVGTSGEVEADIVVITESFDARLGAFGPALLVTYLDRVEFGVYATFRWGGPMLATFASQSAHALGEVRSSARLCVVLEPSTPTNTHACTVAALGLLDDLAARTALARYICDVCSGEFPSSLAALTLACYALAPRAIGGLATALTSIARSALECAARHADECTRTTAFRTLRAWDEAWGRDALLAL